MANYIFWIALYVDIFLALSIGGVSIWRTDRFCKLAAAGVTEFPTKFVGLLVLYLVTMVSNVVRIVSGFKMFKYYNRKRAMLYTAPCVICMIFGIILAAAFNDEILNTTGPGKLYEASCH